MKPYSCDLRFRVMSYYKSHQKTSDFTVKGLCKTFDISRSTFYEWKKLDLIDDLYNNHRQKFYNKSIMTDDVVNYIIKYVSRRSTFKIFNLMKNIKKNFNKKISNTSIYNVLRDNNFTHKKLEIKRNPKKKKDMKKLKKELFQNLSNYDSSNIISVDETSIQLSMNPSHGWSLSGKPCYKHTKETRKLSYTMLTAIRGDKIIASCIMKGACRSLEFNKFIINDILGKYQGQAILMDNARTHKSIILRETVAGTTNKIVFNVPYNPETNPIELLFSPLKYYLRTTKKNNTYNDVFNIIQKYLLAVKESTLRGYYKKSLNK